VRLLSNHATARAIESNPSALASAKANLLALTDGRYKAAGSVSQNWDRISRQAATASQRQAAIGLDGCIRGAAEISCACRYPEAVGKRAEGAPESGGDHALDWRAGQAKTFGYRLVGDMATMNIQACPQVGILRHGCKTMVC
jgi:hypothetical protein